MGSPIYGLIIEKMWFLLYGFIIYKKCIDGTAWRRLVASRANPMAIRRRNEII